jgi:hypothetical protein
LQCIKNIHSFWFQTAQLPWSLSDE